MQINYKNYIVMKKVYIAILSSLILGFSSNVMSQNNATIPNHSFENWTTEGFMFFQHDIPVGWKGLSIAIDTFGMQFSYPISTISKSTDAQNGSYAAMLETKEFDTLISTALNSMGLLGEDFNFEGMPSIMSIGGINVLPMFRDLVGMMGSGDMSLETLLTTLLTTDLSEYLEGGMALNGFVPGGLKGYYKYIPGQDNDEDAAMIMILGTRYDATTHRRTIAGVGMTTLGETNNEYQEFEIPYFALPVGSADTLEIIIFSSQIQSMAMGSKLYIDNLSLSNPNSITSADNNTNINCYPNPSNGDITLTISNNTPADVIFYNSVGAKVLEQKHCNNGTHFNLSQSGSYIMEVTQNGYKTIKTIVIK